VKITISVFPMLPRTVIMSCI